ncbi:MAG: hypothetical protein AAGD96_20705 [Chloroflexota bacterium]
MLYAIDLPLALLLISIIHAGIGFFYVYWAFFLKDFLAEDVAPFVNHWTDWITLIWMHIYLRPERGVKAQVSLINAYTWQVFDVYEVSFITTCNSLRSIELHAESEFERNLDFSNLYPDLECHVFSLDLPYYLVWEIPNEQGLDYRYPCPNCEIEK